MGNFICIFCNFLVRQLYCNQRECFNKNLFLKISQYSLENTWAVRLFFHKVTGLYSSGLQRRCFLVNNINLRTFLLKNICKPFLLFLSQLFEAVRKKTHFKNKMTETHLNAALWKEMKRNHWNMPLSLYYRLFRLSGVQFEIDTDKKSTPIWILYHF